MFRPHRRSGQPVSGLVADFVEGHRPLTVVMCVGSPVAASGQFALAANNRVGVTDRRAS